MTVKALDKAWWEMLTERMIIRSFERTGLSLKVDGSENSSKMKFQGQAEGIPDGLINNY